MTMPLADSAAGAEIALLSDGELLTRYVVHRDQAAFAILVQRHGPMVLGVSRRVLHHDQDTEDAVQTAFVVLARKAGTIAKLDSVASWLYKVTYRIALRLRKSTSRRLALEQRQLPKSIEAGLGDVVDRELRQVLDEEVQRLPEKYRSPILLCYLQGQTNEKAAALLHCPTGTIKIRLLRGRALLRKRLVKRGLAMSALGLLQYALENMAVAAIPQTLCRAATQAALGNAAPAVATLAEAALKSMCMAKLKVAAVVLLTLALTCLADGLLSRAAAAPVTRIEKLLQPEAVPTAVQQPVVAQAD